MRTLSPAELSPLVRFSPRPGRAIEEGGAVLTLLELSQIVGEGAVDLEEGDDEAARTVKRPARVEGSGEGSSAGSGQGWWELASGLYLARVNERIAFPPGSLLLLQPHPRILANGVWHLPAFLRSEREMERGILLVVGAKGVRLRENAPVSLATVLA